MPPTIPPATPQSNKPSSVMLSISKTSWEALEQVWQNGPQTSFEQRLRLLDLMYKHAQTLGKIPPKDPLKGLETAIRISRITNGVDQPPH